MSQGVGTPWVGGSFFFVYYESIKRELNIRLILKGGWNFRINSVVLRRLVDFLYEKMTPSKRGAEVVCEKKCGTIVPVMEVK